MPSLRRCAARGPRVSVNESTHDGLVRGAQCSSCPRAVERLASLPEGGTAPAAGVPRIVPTGRDDRNRGRHAESLLYELKR